MKKHNKLTLTERQLLAQWKEEGLSNRECASRLNRHPATVGRELNRNMFQGRFYEPLHAQRRSEVRKRRAWKAKCPLKNEDIYSHVLEKLRDGWSPEQIAGSW